MKYYSACLPAGPTTTSDSLQAGRSCLQCKYEFIVLPILESMFEMSF